MDSPADDLLIKPGSFIRQGETIVNPVKQRATLVSQQRTLEAKLSTLSNTSAVNLTTQLEEEKIALAQKQVDVAQAALNDYKRNSPWTDFARTNLPLAQEEVRMTRLQTNIEQAQRNLATAQANLVEKQAAIRAFQSEQIDAQKTVQGDLAQVSQKLAGLKPIKSAHTGTVKTLDYSQKKAAGQPVLVTVVLEPGDSPPANIPESALPTGLPIDSPLPSSPLGAEVPPGLPSGLLSNPNPSLPLDSDQIPPGASVPGNSSESPSIPNSPLPNSIPE